MIAVTHRIRKAADVPVTHVIASPEPADAG
jgi:hypothetical protein